MKHLLYAWPEIMDRLEKSSRILLLSDYDGTLSPIVDRPEVAYLPDSTRYLLQMLARQDRINLGIVSGRALADLRSRVGIDGIIYAGNHGLEIEGPGISFVNPVAEETRPVLCVLHRLLCRAMGQITGVIVEDKGLTLSIHYRMVPEDRVQTVKDIFERAIRGAEALGKVLITSGKMVFEVRPRADWNKGKAAKLLMKRYGKGGRKSGLFPIYLSDDVTDEDAFRVIENYGTGLSVVVGGEERSTAARYALNAPEEVESFLGLLLNHVQRASNGCCN